ncbi:sulfotransferase [Candidatus Laterigemmans baculatus]|uniref:sulfotransferase n=1 Tax=Candidatus Laterigemmans baculatus TaxID=2770505 RepID=UPI0013DBE415|nr:sulfotransferase [Candidatus Laterigemmans baculatus]
MIATNTLSSSKNTMVMPNFLVIGAMKSGTTSLWKYLAAHPSVFMTDFKEPGFFAKEHTWERGWGWYQGLFAGAGGAVAIGEASTHYTKTPLHEGVAARIAEHLPNVRFIYVMREPLSRAVSHYWHSVHYNDETRSMARALRRHSHYVDVSCYAMQLEPYFQHFPREQFFLTTFEKLKSDPQTVMRACYRFLRIDPEVVPQNLGEAYNSGQPTVRRARGVLHAVRYSPIWTRIAPWVPQRLKDCAKRHEYTEARREPGIPQQVVEHLYPIFQEQNERLFERIGERFTEWEPVSDAHLSKPIKPQVRP